MTGELAATMIGESTGLMAYSKQVIVCGRSSRVIDRPGVAIMRGRMVMHVRCD